MAELKTKPTQVSVESFLAQVDPAKRADCATLIALMRRVTGEPPKMWGPSIVGFGRYHYKYESGHEGDSCLCGFSPRKAAFSIYATCDLRTVAAELAKLGKHKAAVGCLYVKRLADIDLAVLERIVVEGVRSVRERYPEPAASGAARPAKGAQR